MTPAWLLAGAAVAGPLLLEQLGGRGLVPVQAYVTAGQRAAVAALNRPLLGVAPETVRPELALRANHHLTRVFRALRDQRGANGRHAGLPKYLSAAEGASLGDAFLAAFRDGASVSSEAYKVVTVDLGLGPEALARLNQDAARAIVAGEALDALTDLGQRAQELAAEVAIAKGELWGSFDDGEDLMLALAALTAEMDARGYSVFGDPGQFDITTSDVLEELADWARGAAGRLAGGAGELALGVLGDILLSTPVLLAAGGYLVWRRLR